MHKNFMHHQLALKKEEAKFDCDSGPWLVPSCSVFTVA
jgi:hypothetical protein